MGWGVVIPVFEESYGMDGLPAEAVYPVTQVEWENVSLRLLFQQSV